ncbi:LysR family transcriptional regulator [Pseudoduganella sp. FT26W]|jgi:DNA-binding transcriptional LysR family regulator|uniref:LysR family transcriptional regulator n=1 Tax=Duganella aquatilis TaxID=2666082 RepID=A0A844D2U1_9BURK|nr:LysR family transcriptional regulator [Duganella aquatilis]MRW87387.1 LysR family transcriptional regulator [Duganella aquatilis]
MDYFLAAKAFVSVAETGSFVKTAAMLDLPRNTVTKLIQALEAHLRVKLFHRTTRRVSLTNDGAAYYERMSRVLDEWHEAEADLTDAHSAPRGKLRVDMGTTMASILVIPALPDFRRKYPDLQLDIGISDRPVNLVHDRVDCVVRGGEIADQSLIARHIGALRFVTCATPEYLSRHGTPSHPSDLQEDHVLVRYFYAGSGRKAPIEYTKGDERILVQGRQFLAVNDSNAYLAAGLAGLGVLHTLAFMAQPHIDAGRLVPILQEWSSPPNQISIVYLPNRHLSARVRVFVDWMVELFQKADYL